ncbi:ProQ/FinO family protein [Achromobacter aegrifaciens]|uniref:ProQ/FinO family protein n=1 Tax=Achromobacter aegrifaciens TaxID=1287736 RepID=UPI00320B29E5
MGFEKLADLREQLRAQAQKAVPVQPKAAGRTKKREPDQAKATARPQQKRESGQAKAAARAQQKREPVDPAVEAIWRLQKHFPQAFPKNPAPKLPLKQGILADAAQHLEKLGMTEEQLKQAIATWCKGSRYWSSMVADATRVDLQGQPAGTVTAEQAAYARRQASRRPAGKARPAKKAAAPAAASADAPAPEAAPEAATVTTPASSDTP